MIIKGTVNVVVFWSETEGWHAIVVEPPCKTKGYRGFGDYCGDGHVRVTVPEEALRR